jgi:hypothetical protein
MRALSHVKAHPITFVKNLETGHVDGGVMNKYISTLILLNEAVPFLFTKPLNRSFCHSAGLPKKSLFPNSRPALWQRKQSLKA